MDEKWLNGSFIKVETDYDEIEGQAEHLIFSWFRVNLNLQESESEKIEKVKARQQQIASGVIQPNGMPAGYEIPKKIENRYERKRRRELERKIHKNRQNNFNTPFRNR